ncbi:MAG: hypothetical protein COV72_00525 [Candidatus Omnitrophica bacterium CG11_big_fil_rev_8_21_14_0_20_42_13]|uniref:Nucleoside phosphorylase domain-containing protein n=1 Tax=Candidatus Ghiorseimicrobium undicola TaxID=1974746 RepID=A0A2H0M1Z4_9BACT|nr:MAG: hypothetical protein COV72_00525 [Candidatus Omnitrophica bacterium CG11_big_fil_rev_8_21_14_0_20_42_13]
MNEFKILFGTDKGAIKHNCLILPYLSRQLMIRLGIVNMPRGKLYAVAQAKNFSIIHTRMAPAFLGDAVLYLKDTPARNLMLFGSCGLVDKSQGLDIGDLVAAEKAYSFESFTQMLSEESKPGIYYPDGKMLDCLLRLKPRLKKVICATVGSLKLEDGNPIFNKYGINIADMECSAFFAASGYIKRAAAAIFYISDIIGKKPFYSKYGPADKKAISRAVESAAEIICQISKNPRLS